MRGGKEKEKEEVEGRNGTRRRWTMKRRQGWMWGEDRGGIGRREG